MPKAISNFPNPCESLKQTTYCLKSNPEFQGKNLLYPSDLEIDEDVLKRKFSFKKLTY